VECFTPATNAFPIAKACARKPVLCQERSAFFDVQDRQAVRNLAR